MPYESIAKYYDTLMSHVKYGEWITLINRVIKKYCGGKKISILELGAGTGTLGRKLVNREYGYCGLDISFNMIKLAHEKNLPVVCADACSLPLKNMYDMVIFLYDGINYFLSLQEYKKVFASVSRCLPEGGLFLFDITTETNSYRYFYDFNDIHEIDGSTILRHSYFNPEMFLQYNDFTVFTPVENMHPYYSREDEQHKQKIFTPVKIESAIPDDLFDCLGIWDGYSMKQFSKHSERIHFLLKKISP